MNPILAVGSVAFDSIKTPFGEASRVVGGAAYFAIAASFFTSAHRGGRGRRLRCERRQGVRQPQYRSVGSRRCRETFRWKGVQVRPEQPRNDLRTSTCSEALQAEIPDGHGTSPFVFLGNIHPTLQVEVLDQVQQPTLVGADTMNYWIERTPDDLKQVLKRVDVLLINDSEARELAGEANLVKAARKVQAMGPKTLVIKRGEHGVLMTRTGGGFFAAPAMPLEEVFDPTGAGDTFAGGFLGYLASCDGIDDAALARAIIYGSTLASFAVEDFSVERLLRLTRAEVAERFSDLKQLTHFDVV
jgi:hypothetical protein